MKRGKHLINSALFSEIQKSLDRFTMNKVESYSEILFDPTNFQVIIGAR